MQNQGFQIILNYRYRIPVTRYRLPEVITIPISHWLLQVLPSEKEMKRDLMNNAIYNEYNLQELEATFTYVSQVSYLIVTIFVSNLCVSPLAGRCSDTYNFSFVFVKSDQQNLQIFDVFACKKNIKITSAAPRIT